MRVSMEGQKVARCGLSQDVLMPFDLGGLTYPCAIPFDLTLAWRNEFRSRANVQGFQPGFAGWMKLDKATLANLCRC